MSNEPIEHKPGWTTRGKRLVAGASIVAASVVGVATVAAVAQTSPTTTAPADDTTSTTAPSDGDLSEGGATGGGTTSGTSDAPSAGRSTGGRITGLSHDLALRSARIDSVNLDDDDSEYVVYQFENFVRSVVDESGFKLVGPSVDTVASAESARLVQGSPNEVLVAFPSGTDLNAYSIATVEADVVEDETGQGNVPATTELDGSTLRSGRSAGPDLITVSLNDTLDRATFRFDENLDEDGSANADAFGLYTFDGNILRADRVVSVEDDQVVVEFDDQVEDGVRFFAAGAAVQDRQGIDSVPGSLGEDTTSPDLESVSRVAGDTQFDFRFNDEVVNIEPSAFAVYDDNGTRYEAADWARIDADTVRLIFPEIDDFTDNIVVAAVDSDAAEANDGSGVHNTVGSATVNGDGIDAGATSGPDLESVSVDESSGQVRFIFDENVDDDIAYDAGNYYVVTRAGDLVPGRTFVEASDNWVLVTFDKNVVEAADGYVVLAGAAQDFAGNESPAGSL